MLRCREDCHFDEAESSLDDSLFRMLAGGKQVHDVGSLTS